MKYPFLLILAFLSFQLISCNNDDTTDDPMDEHNGDHDHDNHGNDHGDDETIDYQYHAHINSPEGGMKHLGETLSLRVNFESHSGETVHHVQVRIYEKDGGKEIYKKPDDAHVHAMDGAHAFEDDLPISAENGFVTGTNYVLEAKVWGLDTEDGMVFETIEFMVHM